MRTQEVPGFGVVSIPDEAFDGVRFKVLEHLEEFLEKSDEDFNKDNTDALVVAQAFFDAGVDMLGKTMLYTVASLMLIRRAMKLADEGLLPHEIDEALYS